jgi:hypothetical protein
MNPSFRPRLPEMLNRPSSFFLAHLDYAMSFSLPLEMTATLSLDLDAPRPSSNATTKTTKTTKLALRKQPARS